VTKVVGDVCAFFVRRFTRHVERSLRCCNETAGELSFPAVPLQAIPVRD
jgi:hypothetical protein